MKANLPMRQIKRYAMMGATVIVVIIIAVFFSINSGVPTETTTESTTETTTETTTESTTVYVEPENINRLTGLADLSDEAIGTRPIAIMINNLKGSLPQYGIYDADIMYEIEVEGGITRMMAIYADYTKVPKVCSVRSCRYYFPIFAHGYDAIYFSYGSNETLGTPTLTRIGIDYFDGTTSSSSVFGKDSVRLQTYSSEHTAYVDGTLIPTLLDSTDTRITYDEGFDVNVFDFVDEVDFSSTVGTTTCSKVNLVFSTSYYSTFTYSEETGTYFKQHSGSAHIDSSNGEQLNYVNVFVLETDVTNYTDGYLKVVDWTGGTGYYISGGYAQEITWTKDTERSMIQVFDLDGNEIEVNAGNSYIGVIDYDSTTVTA